MSRRPLDLLERAVPQWLPLLRPGGALGLSWNTKVARRELAEDILLANGLEIVRARATWRTGSTRASSATSLVARKPG